MAEDAAKGAGSAESDFIYRDGPAQQSGRGSTTGNRSGRDAGCVYGERVFWSCCGRESGGGEYTGKKGDPQSFDFGYALAEEVKFLQAMSLKTDVRLGAGLASRFAEIAQDIYRRSEADGGIDRSDR